MLSPSPGGRYERAAVASDLVTPGKDSYPDGDIDCIDPAVRTRAGERMPCYGARGLVRLNADCSRSQFALVVPIEERTSRTPPLPQSIWVDLRGRRSYVRTRSRVVLLCMRA
jgi:hypothetical protein